MKKVLAFFMGTGVGLLAAYPVFIQGAPLYIHQPRYPVCIAVHRNPHTVLRHTTAYRLQQRALSETFGERL